MRARETWMLGMVVVLLSMAFPARHQVVIRAGRAAYAEAETFLVEVDPPPEATEETASAFQVEVIREDREETSKRVLIYHSHTYEAYEQVEGQAYRPIEKWRTTDSEHNVIAVGKALAANLRALGLTVEHDTTAFEPPNLEDAYDRSLTMLESRQRAGETYDLYIDLHRDAIASSSTIRRSVNIGGEDVARFMVLVGKGTTGGYAEKPNWEANLLLAQTITDGLNRQCDNLARDVKIKTGRFNQHVADCCVLIECGMNSNTLPEVLAGVPYLAQAIAEALQSTSTDGTENPR